MIENELTKVRNQGGRGEYGIGGSMNSSLKASKRVSAAHSTKKFKKKSRLRGSESKGSRTGS